MGLERLWMESGVHMQRGKDDVQFLIELLVKFRLILPLKATAAEERRFLIPCMLPRREVKLDQTEPFTRMSKAYEAEYITSIWQMFPIGTFSKLIAEASQTWPICQDDHLSFGYASFQVEDGIRLALTHPHGFRIQVSLWCQPQSVKMHPLRTLLATREVLQEYLSNCDIPNTPEFQLLCPHWSPAEEQPGLVKVQKTVDPVSKKRRIEPVNPNFKCRKKLVTWRDFFPGEYSCIDPPSCGKLYILPFLGLASGAELWSLRVLSSSLCEKQTPPIDPHHWVLIVKPTRYTMPRRTLRWLRVNLFEWVTKPGKMKSRRTCGTRRSLTMWRQESCATSPTARFVQVEIQKEGLFGTKLARHAASSETKVSCLCQNSLPQMALQERRPAGTWRVGTRWNQKPWRREEGVSHRTQDGPSPADLNR